MHLAYYTYEGLPILTMSNFNEADTCRKYVLPKLYAAGWNDDQISEQKSFTDGRIIIAGKKASRKKQKRADYLLRYRRDFTIAVVEAKPEYKQPGDGLQQAKEYAEILGLKFAYATNGHGIVEHDFLTGSDNDIHVFPTPEALWGRLKQAEHISDDIADRLLEPYYHLSGNRRGITKRSPSTEPYKRSCRANAACCSPSPPEPAKRLLRSKSAGNCGTRAGIGLVSIDGRGFCT